MNITTPEQWQAERLQGIGASEASAVIGKNPWMSNVDLWRIKTGRKAAEDISDKACVQYGHDAEPLIRGLFALDYQRACMDCAALGGYSTPAGDYS